MEESDQEKEGLKKLYLKLRGLFGWIGDLRKNKMGFIGFIILLVFAALAIFPSLFAPHHPQERFNTRQPPSFDHPFGTSTAGKDIFSQTVYGTRLTFAIGLGAVGVELVLGFLVGGLAGYFGGKLDEGLMRIADIVLSLPPIIVLILAVSMFEERSAFLIIIIMGFLGWPWIGRVIRSQFLSIKENLYVKASQAMGAKDISIIFRHIIPNAIFPILVMISLDIPGYILWYAMLAFLGMGDPTVNSWGIIIQRGKRVFLTMPHMAILPGLMLFILLLSFNMFGDGLRDVFEMRIRGGG